MRHKYATLRSRYAPKKPKAGILLQATTTQHSIDPASRIITWRHRQGRKEQQLFYKDPQSCCHGVSRPSRSDVVFSCIYCKNLLGAAVRREGGMCRRRLGIVASAACISKRLGRPRHVGSIWPCPNYFTQSLELLEPLDCLYHLGRRFLERFWQ